VGKLNNSGEQPADGLEPREREELVEGGYIRPLDEYSFRARHREHTARTLAYVLVGILGGSFVLHYTATLVLQARGRIDAAESLARIFNAWLPAITGLVGSAVTYYFTKEKD
jgi:hypothetical protein